MKAQIEMLCWRVPPETFASNAHALAMHFLMCAFSGGKTCSAPYVFRPLPELPILENVPLPLHVIEALLRGGSRSPSALNTFVTAPVRTPELASVFGDPMIPVETLRGDGFEKKLADGEKAALHANPGFGVDDNNKWPLSPIHALSRLLYSPKDGPIGFHRDFWGGEANQLAVRAMRLKGVLGQMALHLLTDTLQDAEIYRHLTLTDQHIKLVREQGGVYGAAKTFCLDGEPSTHVLSPACPQELAEEIWRAGGSEELRGSALCYYDTPRVLYREAFEKLNPLLGSELFGFSRLSHDVLAADLSGLLPHGFAQEALIATCRFATSEQKLAYLRSNRIETMNHRRRFIDDPAFPFEQVLPDEVELFLRLAPKYLAEAFSIGAATSPGFAAQLEHAAGREAAAVGALFSEATSERRLDKIAREFSELAPLAACHPNGDSIKILSFSRANRVIVEAVRNNRFVPVVPASTPVAVVL